MLSTITIIIILGILSGLSTLVGTVLAFFFNRCQKAVVIGLSFAAGIMVLISVFELIPESVNGFKLNQVILFSLFGVGVISLLNKIIPHTHLCKKEKNLNTHLLKTAYLCATGLIMHDFPEGFAMANSYLHSPKLGILVTIAIMVHNIPEEFAITLPLLAAKKERKFIIKMALVSGLAEPAGAIIGLLAVSVLPMLNPFFMAFAAGAMIFISLHELIPVSIKYNHNRKILSLFGLLLSALVYLILQAIFPE